MENTVISQVFGNITVEIPGIKPGKKWDKRKISPAYL